MNVYYCGAFNTTCHIILEKVSPMKIHHLKPKNEALAK